MADLQRIYQALTFGEAKFAFVTFKEKWGKKHPIIVRSWENIWLELTAYFKYPYQIRRLIYTDNVEEGFHRQLISSPLIEKSIYTKLFILPTKTLNLFLILSIRSKIC